MPLKGNQGVRRRLWEVNTFIEDEQTSWDKQISLILLSHGATPPMESDLC